MGKMVLLLEALSTTDSRLATLQFVLDKGQELDWFGSHTITLCVTISAAAFVARSRQLILVSLGA